MELLVLVTVLLGASLLSFGWVLASVLRKKIPNLVTKSASLLGFKKE